jgi:hypothetical protein
MTRGSQLRRHAERLVVQRADFVREPIEFPGEIGSNGGSLRSSPLPVPVFLVHEICAAGGSKDDGSYGRHVNVFF